MTTTTASSEVTPDRSSPPGASARCSRRLIGPATDEQRQQDAEGDEAALDDAPARQVAARRR